MKPTQLILIVILFVIAACSVTKKNKTSTASSASGSTTVTTTIPSSDDYLFTKVSDGIYAPGNEELIALQAQYKDVTLEKLQEGHTIYTQGACINCHGAQNIYRLQETEWKNIIDDMALRANISDAQKDAVFKYVLAIKATQPK